MLIRLRYAIGLFLLFFVSTIWADVPVPALSKRVTDLTDTLTATQSTLLENKLAAFESKKGSQIAVLILPTTLPETIEAFGIRVADTWKIGRKNIDDGVILIVAKDDHKMRIEVGRGLEGAIPDAIAKRVIEEIIIPKFKANNFYDGIDSGVSQLIQLTDGELLPGSTGHGVVNVSKSGDNHDGLIVIGLVAFLLLDLFLSFKFGVVTAAICMGSISSIAGGVISFLDAFDIFIILLITFNAFFVGVIISILIKLAISSNSSDRAWSSGSGSFSGGSFNSGGFSGGGGCFSGGGASGSW